MEDTLHQVYKSLTDLESFDPDLRFMALEDIYQALHEDRGQLATQRVLQRVSAGVLKALQDQNTEIQNQAVKALGALVVVQTSEIPAILSDILKSASTAKDLALRAVLTNAPKTPESSQRVVEELVPFVCTQTDPSIETIDVFLELVRNYRSEFSETQIDSCVLRALALTRRGSGLVSKRAFDVILSLAPLTSREQVQTIVTDSWPQPDDSQQYTVGTLGLYSGLVDLVPQFCDEKFTELAQELVEFDEENVDVSEAALALLAALERHNFTNPKTKALVCEALDYNPNRGDMDGDDMDDDDFADSEVEEDFDDDTEESWKIRCAACRVVEAAGASGFVPELVQALATELNEPVKRELLRCLEAATRPDNAPQGRARRGSDASMQTNAGTLEPFLGQILKLATSDPLPAYLSLVELLVEHYSVDSATLEKLLVDRLSLKQVQPVLRVLHAVLLHSEAELSEQASCGAINAGLSHSAFQTQALALQCAELLQSTAVLGNVKQLALEGVGSAIRIQAFDTATKIVKHHPGYVQEYVELGCSLLASQREQRTATVTSLLALFPAQLPEPVTSQLRQQLLELFTTTSPTLTCSCLELLSLLPPEDLSMVPSKVLALPNDVQYIDLKAKVLALYPDADGLLAFALEVAQLKDYTELKVPRRNVEVSPLIQLFGKLAAAKSGVLKQVTAVFKETPLWAEIIAEVIVASGAPSPAPSSPLTNWFMLVALFLTLRGRSVVVVDYDSSQVDSVVLGYCLGANAISNPEQFLKDTLSASGGPGNASGSGAASALSSVEILVMRANLSQDALGAAWQATELPYDEKSQPILERILGHLVALTGDLDRFSRWDNTEIGLNASKTAFTAVKQDSLKVALLRKFIAATQLEDQKLKGIAAKALAWTTQIEPRIVEPYADEMLANALKATTKDPALVRKVKIGPFTHEIDDGLDYRKACYELIYMCIYNFPHLAVDSWEPVLAGLDENEDNDVKILVCLCLDKLELDAIKPFLTCIFELFKTNENIKIKETGTKLEHDRQAALVRQLALTTKDLEERMKKECVRV